MNKGIRLVLALALMLLIFEGPLFAEGDGSSYLESIKAATWEMKAANNHAQRLDEPGAAAECEKRLRKAFVKYDEAVVRIGKDPYASFPKLHIERMRRFQARIEKIRFMLLANDDLSQVPDILDKLCKETALYWKMLIHVPFPF
jgi:hypothetical protein